MPTWSSSLTAAETAARADVSSASWNNVDVWIPPHNAFNTWAQQRWVALGNTLPAHSFPQQGYWFDVIVRAVSDQAARPSFSSPLTGRTDTDGWWRTVSVPVAGYVVFQDWIRAVWANQKGAAASAAFSQYPELVWSQLVINEAVSRGVS